MIPWYIEIIYVVAQGIFILRLFYQTNETRKAKQSITPFWYWIMTFFAEILFIIYGLLLGSWAIPSIAILSLPFIFYHISVELRRNTIEHRRWLNKT